MNTNLPMRHECHVVPVTAHLAFLAPCPPGPLAKLSEFCTDVPGFDRVAFHQQLDAALVTFFQTRLTEAP